MDKISNVQNGHPAGSPPSRYSHWLRRNRRSIGIPMVIAALFLARYDSRFLVASIVLVVIGEALRIWAAGHLRKEQQLTTGGPYRFIRNPLYLGSFLIAVGFALVAGSLWVWLLIILYFTACYIPVIRWEQNVLEQKFGAEYSRYATAIPALYPALRLYDSPSSSFSWRQVMRNKEYNAVLGILAGYVFLILRASGV